MASRSSRLCGSVMNVLRVLLTLILLLPSLVAIASHTGQREYTRFLVPLIARNVPGAHGSLWTVDTWIHYDGETEAFILPTPFCLGILCPDGLTVEPGLAPFRLEHPGLGEPGLLVHVESDHGDDFQFSSRVQDVSRSAVTAGAAVPVVREDAMHTGTVRLLNVPVDEVFRSTLRVYALPDLREGEVEVRYYLMPVFGGSSVDLRRVLLREERVTLRDPAANEIPRRVGSAVLGPLFAETENVAAFPELPVGSAIWIEVVPVTPGLRIWAMVSITNNVTQQVTLVTP